MHAAALSVILLSGICSEPCADDCGQCMRPRYSFCESWHKFWCGIAKPCNCHINDWPLEYAPGPGEYDYRAQMNYPWSNTPSQPPYGDGPCLGGPYRGQQARPINEEEAKRRPTPLGEKLTSVLKQPDKVTNIRRTGNQSVDAQPTEAVPLEASQPPAATRR
jgi:hypothetical protein